MCKAVENYAKERWNKGKIEGIVETVKNMLQEGISLATALKYVKLDKETYEKCAERI